MWGGGTQLITEDSEDGERDVVSYTTAKVNSGQFNVLKTVYFLNHVFEEVTFRRDLY